MAEADDLKRIRDMLEYARTAQKVVPPEPPA